MKKEIKFDKEEVPFMCNEDDEKAKVRVFKTYLGYHVPKSKITVKAPSYKNMGELTISFPVSAIENP